MIKKRRRDWQALYAKLRAQVLHRVDTCQPVPRANPELFRQLLASSLPPPPAASRRLKDRPSLEIRSLDREEGQDCPQPLLASSELGLVATTCHPNPVCVACWQKPGMVLGHHCGGQMELPAAGLDVVFLVHSDRLLGI